MVRSIDENDFDRRFPKGFGRSQAPKTATDDHYSRCLRLLPIRTIDRIEIGIVHPLFSQAFEPRNFSESWQRRQTWNCEIIDFPNVLSVSKKRAHQILDKYNNRQICR